MEQENIKSYYTELGYRLSLIKKYNREANLLLSGNFNVFNYIYVDENKLSDIIADLLNPEGSHGQQDLFLNEFLRTLNRSNLIGTSQLPSVSREVGTRLISRTQRRMDILVEWSMYGIMIENKPWDKDQDDQLFDYKSYLEKRFGSNYIILYLTKKGDNPGENSLKKEILEELTAKGQFLNISYGREVREWIKACIKECYSEKMRYFLRDLLNYLSSKLINTNERSSESNS